MLGLRADPCFDDGEADPLDEVLESYPHLDVLWDRRTAALAHAALRELAAEHTGPPPPDHPTDVPAGSELKIRLMIARRARGLQLCHPQDAPADPDGLPHLRFARPVSVALNGMVRGLGKQRRPVTHVL